MKHIVLLIATYLVLSAQAACSHALAVGGCVPPLMWIPVLLALIWFGDGRAILWAATIGLLADGLSGGRFGTQMLVATLTASLGLVFRPEDDERSRWLLWMWQFVVIGAGVGLSHVLETLLSDGPILGGSSIMTMVGESVYGLVLMSWTMALRRPAARGHTRGARLRLT
jgi:rod shape-determining protein MreD